jgi:hypothetical protein
VKLVSYVDFFIDNSFRRRYFNLLLAKSLSITEYYNELYWARILPLAVEKQDPKQERAFCQLRFCFRLRIHSLTFDTPEKLPISIFSESLTQ